MLIVTLGWRSWPSSVARIPSTLWRYCQRQTLTLTVTVDPCCDKVEQRRTRVKKGGGGETVAVPWNWASSSTFRHQLFAIVHIVFVFFFFYPTKKKWQRKNGFEVCLLQIDWTLLEFTRDVMNECQGMHSRFIRTKRRGWVKRRMPTEHFYVYLWEEKEVSFLFCVCTSVEVAMHPRQPWIIFIHIFVWNA